MSRLRTIYPAVSPVVRIPREMPSQLYGQELQLTLEGQRQGRVRSLGRTMTIDTTLAEVDGVVERRPSISTGLLRRSFT